MSHIAGFTFQFLTSYAKKHYFSTRINISNRFNHYGQFYEALELGSVLRLIAASKVNELGLESQKRGYRHVINAFWLLIQMPPGHSACWVCLFQKHRYVKT